MDMNSFLQTVWSKLAVFFTQVVPDFLAIYTTTIIEVIFLVVLGYIIGKVLKTAMVKLLEVVGFKKITTRSWAENVLKVTGYRGTIVELIGDLVKWLIYILFLALIIETLGLPGIANLFTQLVAFMPRFIGAVIIAVIGFIIADFFGKIFEEAARRFFDEDILSSLSGGLVKYSIALVTIIIVLSLVGLDPTSLTVLFTLLLGTVIILILLGVKDIFPDYSAGLHLKNALKPGQEITVGPHSGTIDRIQATNTVLKKDGKEISIPNSYLINNPVEKKIKD